MLDPKKRWRSRMLSVFMCLMLLTGYTPMIVLAQGTEGTIVESGGGNSVNQEGASSGSAEKGTPAGEGTKDPGIVGDEGTSSGSAEKGTPAGEGAKDPGISGDEGTSSGSAEKGTPAEEGTKDPGISGDGGESSGSADEGTPAGEGTKDPGISGDGGESSGSADEGTPAGEGTKDPGISGDGGTSSGSADEGAPAGEGTKDPGIGGDEGTSSGSADEGTPGEGTKDPGISGDEGTSSGSADEGTPGEGTKDPGIGGDEGTSSGSADEGTPGEGTKDPGIGGDEGTSSGSAEEGTPPGEEAEIQPEPIPEIAPELNAAADWYSGDPTADEFSIGDADELAYLSDLVNSGTESFQGKSITLTGDIDLAGIENWTPIGTAEHSFQGTFNGAEHVIKNLTVDRPEADYAGLFGYVDGASLKYLGIEGGTVKGNRYAGAIAGYAGGETTIDNCYNTASVTADGQAGGIAGSSGADSVIRKCYTLSEDADSIAKGSGTISNSYYLIDDGGTETEEAKTAAAFNSGEVSWLLNTAGGTGEHSGVWGLAGMTAGNDALEQAPVFSTKAHPAIYKIKLTNLDGDSETPGQVISAAGEYVPEGTQVTLNVEPNDDQAKYTLEVKGISPEGLSIDENNQFNMPDGDVEIEYILTPHSDGTSWYTANPEADDFCISTAEDLAYLSELVNGGVSFMGKTISLTHNINLSGMDWIPIGNSAEKSFQGTFDGDGHIIRDLTVNQPTADYGGLFGYVANASILNLGIDGGTVAGKDYTGGIVGYAAGTTELKNCYSRASVSGAGNYTGGIAGLIGGNITDSSNDGGINGAMQYTGGLAGYMTGDIMNSSNSGTVTALNNYSGGLAGAIAGNIASSHNSGTISGSSYVGGLVGNETLTNTSFMASWNSGDIAGGTSARAGGLVGGFSSSGTKTTIDKCYNAGTVAGGTNSGGIVGYSQSGTTISNCYSLAATDNPIKGRANGTVTNSYYLIADSGTEEETSDGEWAKKAASFNSGEVSWLLNTVGGAGEHSGVWGLGEMTAAGNTALRQAPVLKDGEHPAIYKLTLTKEETEGSPGELIWDGGEYVAQGSQVTLEIRLDSGRSGYVLETTEITGLNPDDLESDEEKGVVRFVMPSDNVEIHYKLSSDGQSWYKNNPDAEELYVGSAAELAYLAQLVNGEIPEKTDDFSGQTVILTGDIDLSGVANWTPIGISATNSFRGTFDGAGHVIKNLTADRADYAGLFGYIQNGSVHNLGIAGGTVEAEGRGYAGALAGYAGGTTTIENCYNMASVTAPGGSAGGIAGSAEAAAAIKNCYSLPSVDHPIAGGDGRVDNSYYLAADGTEEDGGGKTAAAFNSGEVSWLLNMSGEDCSGIWGLGESTFGGNAGPAMVPVFTDAAHPGVYQVSLVRQGEAGGTGAAYCTGGEYVVAGNRVELKVTQSSGESTYYVLRVESTTPQDLDIDGGNRFIMPSGNVVINYSLVSGSNGKSWYDDNLGALKFSIGTAADLTYLAQLVNGEIPDKSDDFSGKTITLTADLDLSGVDNWTPIGNSSANRFKGIFDGDGYEIRNLTINRTNSDQTIKDYAGLFGYLDNAEIRNLSIAGGSVREEGNVDAGGIVGYAANGVTIINTHNKGVNVTGSGLNVYVGGIAGQIDAAASAPATVENCSNSAEITNTSTGSANTGGIAGRMEGTVTDCYNTGKITGNGAYVGGIAGSAIAVVTGSYNTGDISGENDVGGIAGTIDGIPGPGWISAAIVSSYNTGKISGKQYVGGIAGDIDGEDTNNIEKSWNSGSISGSGSMIGGIAGALSGTLRNSYNLGEVVYGPSSDASTIGGLAGIMDADSSLSDSYNLPPMANPLKGEASVATAEVSNSYYLSDEETADGGKTAAAFTSGEVAWLLSTEGGTQKHNGLWGMAARTAEGNAGPEKVPVLSDADHPAIYKTVLVNQDTEAIPGKLICAESPYAAPGTLMTLAVELYPGYTGYELELLDSDPHVLIDGNRQFLMPAGGDMPQGIITINYKLGADGQSWYNDNREAENFSIGSAAELAYLAEVVNGEVPGIEENFSGKTITLTNDIDLAGVENWTPVGSGEEHSFQGTFDGAGHLIKNLAVNAAEAEYAGLFGYVRDGAVYNLGIAGGTVRGGSYAGGLVGYAAGTTAVENCYNTAAVEAAGSAGGIAGGTEASVKVSNCYNLPLVDNPIAGGSGTVEYSYYLNDKETTDGGKTAAAFNSGEVSWLLNTTAEEHSMWGLGAAALAGAPDLAKAPVFSSEASPVIYKVILKNLEPEGIPGALVCAGGEYVVPGSQVTLQVELDDGSGGYIYQVEQKNPDNLLIDIDNQFTMPESNVEIGYRLVPGSDGKSWYLDNPDAENFTIGEAADLVYLARLVNEGTDNFSGKTITMSNDIDIGIAGMADWTPIGSDETKSFQGIFDGGGHVIQNLKVDHKDDEQKPADYAGLFGYLSGATLKNLGIAGGSVRGKGRVGGIAGAAASSNFINCSNAASVTGTSTYTGGIVGFIEDSSVITGCSNTGAISGTTQVGGIAGRKTDAGDIKKSRNTGSITGTGGTIGGIVGSMSGTQMIEDSYNSGAVAGTSNVGGIIGNATNTNITIRDCYSLSAKSLPLSGSKGSVKNSYYLNSKETADGGRPAADFASGEVSWLLNMADGTNCGAWGLGGTTFAGLERAPVLADTDHRAIYKVTLINQDFADEEDAPGKVVCAAGAYVEADSPVTLTVTLKDGLSGYVLHVERINPSGLSVTDNQFTMPHSDVQIDYTLALGSGESFTVTFDYQGGTPQGYAGDPAPDGQGDILIKVPLADPFVLAEPAQPTKPGYSFGGWYRPNSDYPFDFTQPVFGRSDFTLQARWGVECPVVYHWNDQETPEESTVTKGSAIIGALLQDPALIETNPPAKEGMEVKWYLSDTFTGEPWDFDATRVSDDMLANGQLTLYGSWQKSIEADTGWYEPGKTLFTLSTPEQLFGFARLVNEGHDFAGQTVQLPEDAGTVIDLNNTPWTPAGTDSAPFRGIFEGNNSTLKGLYINSEQADYQGLFGAIDDSAEIRNLTVQGEVTGNAYTAGIAAWMKGGQINGVTSEVKVTAKAEESVADNGVGGIAARQDGGMISGSGNQGEITGGQRVGGIAGYSEGTIADCRNGSAIKGLGQSFNRGGVGGIAGYLTEDGRITGCENNGTVEESGRSGGIAGYNGGLIDFCTNDGSISSVDESPVGGIAAVNAGGEIRNCTNAGTVTGNLPSSGSEAKGSEVGGIVGENRTSGLVDSCLNKGPLSGRGYYGGGIAGLTEAGTTITRNGNTADIEADMMSLGGIVGIALASSDQDGVLITHNFNSGEINSASTFVKPVVGGIAGNVDGSQDTDNVDDSVSYNYNRGHITGSRTGQGAGTTVAMGGIAGQVGGINSKGTIVFTGNYNAAVLTDQDHIVTSNVGALAGIPSKKTTGGNNYYDRELCQTGAGSNSDGMTAIPESSAEMKSGEFAALLGPSYAQDVLNLNGGYPVLYWQNADTVEGWTVTFNLNDGTSGTLIQTVPDGGKITAFTPVRTGYKFAGWCRDKALSQPFDQETAVTSNLVLYADWDYASYTYTYYKNDGSTGDDRIFKTQRYDYTATVIPVSKKPDEAPEWGESEFLGWYTGAEQPDGTVVLDEQPYVFGSEVTGDLKLYAAWDEAEADYDWYLADPAAPSYVIHTREELTGLAKLVNGTSGVVKGAADFRNQTIALGADLDLTGLSWVPIGANADSPFAGTFDGMYDGQRHALSNLTAGLSGRMYQGLFGYVRNGTLKNLTIAGGSVTGGNSSGAFAGYLDGTLENCLNDGVAVTGGTGSNAGGIAGETGANAVISGAVNKASVTGSRAGGIVGWFRGKELRRSENRGVITGTGNSTVGGLAGMATGSSADSKAILLYNVNLEDVQGTASAAGIVGEAKFSQIAYSYNEGKISGSGVNGGLVGVLNNNSQVYSSYSSGNVQAGSTRGAAVGQRGATDYALNTLTNVYALDNTMADKNWIIAATTVGLYDGSVAYNMNKDLAGQQVPAWTLGTDGYPELADLDGSNAVFRAVLGNEPAEGGRAVLDKTYSNAGEGVTITVVPDTGYVVVLMAVSKKDGSKVDTSYTPENDAYGFVMPQGDVTVTVQFAQYTPGPFTVSFNSNGGSEVPAQTNIATLTKVSKPEDPVKEQAVFQYWSADETLAAAYDFDTLVTQDFTLYAKWKTEGAVYVAFDLNGGPGTPPAAQEVMSGNPVPRPADPEGDAEHCFAGWSREPDGESLWNFETDKAGDQDFTLYAQWSSFEGKGSEDEPFLISGSNSLDQLGDALNSGETFEGVYFRLEDDVSLESPLGEAVVTGAASGKFTIEVRAAFDGIFDGNDHSVSLDIDNPESDGMGLFAYLGEDAEVRNVTVTGSVNGRYLVGGIAGYSAGTITGCSSSAEITGTAGVGGIVGQSDGEISDSSNSGDIRGSGVNRYSATSAESLFFSRVGGIVGYGAEIENCSNSGAVTGAYAYVGGIAGQGTVSGSGNEGDVTGLADLPEPDESYTPRTWSSLGMIGGITGSGSVNQSHNSGTVSAPLWSYVGGITGEGGAKDSENAGIVVGSAVVGGIVGQASESEAIIENVNNQGAVSAVVDENYSDGVSNTLGGSMGVNVGGIAGALTAGASVQNSFNSGTVSGKGDIGGIAGQLSDTARVMQSGNKGTALIEALSDPRPASMVNSHKAQNIGGIAGLVETINADGVKYSYNLAPISVPEGTLNVGGVAGLISNDSDEGQQVVGCFSYEVDAGGNAAKPSVAAVVGSGKAVQQSFYSSGPSEESAEEEQKFSGSGLTGRHMSVLAELNEEAKTAEQFAGGEVAYLLDNGGHPDRTEYWGQRLGSGPYPQPRLTEDDPPAIYFASTSQSGGGTVTVNGQSSIYVGRGDQVIIAAEADEEDGYELESLTVNGRSYANNTSYTVGKADLKVVAAFKTPEDEEEPPDSGGSDGPSPTAPENDNDNDNDNDHSSPDSDGSGSGKGEGSGNGIGDGKGDGIGDGSGNGIGGGAGSGAGSETGDGTGSLSGEATRPLNEESGVRPGETGDNPLEIAREQKENPASGGGGGGSSNKGADDAGNDAGDSAPETRNNLFELSKVVETIRNNPVLSSLVVLIMLGIFSMAAWRRYKQYKDSTK